ncbi:hypothetical protein M0R45_027924 [Rubus argutus]|uniref:DUF7903 domain-containing protein n=1 Tax=Rubus argutus TaxID=59490 RepID=A0AAW1W7R5_RUBAR
MAYIPPHKGRSNEMERPLPTPELLAPQFKKILNMKPSRSNVERASYSFIYAKHSISRWWTIGLDDENQFPSSIDLEPVSMESTEWKIGEKSLALMNTRLDNGVNEVRWNLPESPWLDIAENVLEDLLASFENVRKEMDHKLEQVQPNLVARVGKVLFHRSPSVDVESVRKGVTTEILKQLKRSFYTDVPASYAENIVKEVVLKIRLDFKVEKETYNVKLSDSTRPKSVLSCKCNVTKEQGKLEVYKIELNQLRNMVIDISCPNKNLDLRLMLSSKRIVTSLTDHEILMIKDLINSAVVDPDVKGGLRWLIDRFHVIGNWHTITTTYKNPSLTLKIRHANRFAFTTSTGDTTLEIRLFLKELVSMLQEQNAEVNSVSEKLVENLRLIWENFL